jgi:hypothetical protein
MVIDSIFMKSLLALGHHILRSYRSNFRENFIRAALRASINAREWDVLSPCAVCTVGVVVTSNLFKSVTLPLGRSPTRSWTPERAVNQRGLIVLVRRGTSDRGLWKCPARTGPIEAALSCGSLTADMGFEPWGSFRNPRAVTSILLNSRKDPGETCDTETTVSTIAAIAVLAFAARSRKISWVFRADCIMWFSVLIPAKSGTSPH